MEKNAVSGQEYSPTAFGARGIFNAGETLMADTEVPVILIFEQRADLARERVEGEWFLQKIGAFVDDAVP